LRTASADSEWARTTAKAASMPWTSIWARARRASRSARSSSSASRSAVVMAPA